MHTNAFKIVVLEKQKRWHPLKCFPCFGNRSLLYVAKFVCLFSLPCLDFYFIFMLDLLQHPPSPTTVQSNHKLVSPSLLSIETQLLLEQPSGSPFMRSQLHILQVGNG
eukprot:m.72076 g.72076  ORF g.72076 m.72076 type:complete len:108 (-) comp12325_c0_seq2:2025-2348(-)